MIPLFAFLVQNWNCDLVVPLEVLGKLNKLNSKVGGPQAPYNCFYLTELTEKVDIRMDYVQWLVAKDTHLVSCRLCII